MTVQHPALSAVNVKPLSCTLRCFCFDLHGNTQTLLSADTRSTFSPPNTNKQTRTQALFKTRPSSRAAASGASCTVLIQYVWRNVNKLLRNAAFQGCGFPAMLEDPDTGAYRGKNTRIAPISNVIFIYDSAWIPRS